MGAYRSLHRFVVRAQRASLAVGALWARLHRRSDVSDLSNAHAWHALRLHVRELGNFVGLVHTHFVAGVCEGCWSVLREQLAVATSPKHVRSAHDAFVAAAMAHCLLHEEGHTAGALITGVLALTLSLHREVTEADDDDASAHAADGGGGGASWAVLVEASRSQFALLLTSLAREPLAPAALVHESVVGAY